MDERYVECTVQSHIGRVLKASSFGSRLVRKCSVTMSGFRVGHKHWVDVQTGVQGKEKLVQVANIWKLLCCIASSS